MIRPRREKPNPGSPEAKLEGCACPDKDNNHGRGWMGIPDVFVQVEDCSLHGEKRENSKST